MTFFNIINDYSNKFDSTIASQQRYIEQNPDELFTADVQQALGILQRAKTELSQCFENVTKGLDKWRAERISLRSRVINEGESKDHFIKRMGYVRTAIVVCTIIACVSIFSCFVCGLSALIVSDHLAFSIWWNAEWGFAGVLYNVELTRIILNAFTITSVVSGILSLVLGPLAYFLASKNQDDLRKYELIEEDTFKEFVDKFVAKSSEGFVPNIGDLEDTQLRNMHLLFKNKVCKLLNSKQLRDALALPVL